MVRHEPTIDGHGHAEDQRYVYRRPSRDVRGPDAYADDAYDDGYGYDDEPYGLVDRILAAPGKLAMATVALVAFAVIGVNAAYMQPGAHPAPILSTRGEAPALAMPHDDGRLPERTITMAPSPIVPPARSYDATASIPATQASEPDSIASLLTRQPYAAPSPTPRPAFAATPARQPAAVAAVEQSPTAPPARRVETIAVTDPIGALLAPVVTPNPTIGTNQPLPPAAATRSAQPLVAAVQAVLADMGYQPGSIDGVIGPSTEEAIRRFQLRRALEPNGQITNDLLREIERVTGTRITAS